MPNDPPDYPDSYYAPKDENPDHPTYKVPQLPSYENIRTTTTPNKGASARQDETRQALNREVKAIVAYKRQTVQSQHGAPLHTKQPERAP